MRLVHVSISLEARLLLLDLVDLFFEDLFGLADLLSLFNVDVAHLAEAAAAHDEQAEEHNQESDPDEHDSSGQGLILLVLDALTFAHRD